MVRVLSLLLVHPSLRICEALGSGIRFSSILAAQIELSAVPTNVVEVSMPIGKVGHAP